MDFISLLSGSENLYKYCFIGGLGLIILCLFYPLNKRYELACKKDLHNKEISLLNLEIDDLNKDYEKLKRQVNKYIDTNTIAKSVKDSINKNYASLVLKRKQISFKIAEVKYDSSRIFTLNENIKEITMYERSFYWGGCILSFIGFGGWFLLMLKKHKEKENS